MKNNLVLIFNIISGLAGFGFVLYMFFAVWASGFSTTGGRGLSNKEEIAVLVIFLLTLASIILSHKFPVYGLIISVVPFVVVAILVTFLMMQNRITHNSYVEQNKVVLQEFPKDYNHKSYYSNGNKFNLYGSDTFLSIVGNKIYKVYISENTNILDSFIIGSIDGKNLNLLSEFDTQDYISELKSYIDKDGKNVTEVFTIK